MSPRGVAKVETLKPSMVEEFSKVTEPPQAQEVVEESIVIHVVEETSKEEPCFIMNGTRIEDKGRNIEKELGNFIKDLPIDLSLNPSLMCYDVSLVELELFLEFCLSYDKFMSDPRCRVGRAGKQPNPLESSPGDLAVVSLNESSRLFPTSGIRARDKSDLSGVWCLLYSTSDADVILNLPGSFRDSRELLSSMNLAQVTTTVLAFLSFKVYCPEGQNQNNMIGGAEGKKNFARILSIK
ncbi:hypothetical protein M9H77_17600 [Catharanthus roseus]|uniref:Uncharacterized protein n=1 Tax=Catharanthus roseus TaxID=4058 RepID=A0ACC0B5A5_CATRO|nr:hypothetical protein M9H77_17600 [Catharanthus roseus]